MTTRKKELICVSLVLANFIFEITNIILIFTAIRQLRKFVTNFQFFGNNSIMYSEDFERCVITREVILRDILRIFLALDLLQSLFMKFVCTGIYVDVFLKTSNQKGEKKSHS